MQSGKDFAPTEGRCVRAATLGLIALASYFQSSGISQLCAAKLSGRAALAATEQHASAPEADSKSSRDLVRYASARLGPAGDSNDGTLAACHGMGATLIASFPDTTLWSLAAVTTKVGEKPKLVHVGEPVGRQDGSRDRMEPRGARGG